MRDAGYVISTHGNGGGYRLNRDPQKITLWDIIEDMEDTHGLNRCLEKDHYCSRNATEYCPVRKVYCGIQEEIEKIFRSITIAELIQIQKKEIN